MARGAKASDEALRRAVDSALPGWAKLMVRLFDDSVRVPGTGFRFGLDGLIGLFVPTAGDALTGIGSITLLSLALRQHVPRIVLVRMIGNIAVDVFFGMIPGLGDAFDLAWKSNKRNLNLIQRFQKTGTPPGALDYAVVGLGMLLAVASVIVPIVAMLWLGTKIGGWGLSGLEALQGLAP